MAEACLFAQDGGREVRVAVGIRLGFGFWQRVAAMLVLMALALAPVAEAATHGPGALAMEAEHAAWHDAQGHGHDHDGHHDATDHDHSAHVILPVAAGLGLPDGTSQAVALVPDFAGRAGEGPRRPPRA